MRSTAPDCFAAALLFGAPTACGDAGVALAATSGAGTDTTSSLAPTSTSSDATSTSTLAEVRAPEVQRQHRPACGAVLIGRPACAPGRSSITQ